MAVLYETGFTQIVRLTTCFWFCCAAVAPCLATPGMAAKPNITAKTATKTKPDTKTKSDTEVKTVTKTTPDTNATTCEGWVYKGKHFIYGQGTLYASCRGAVMDNQMAGRLAICKPPDWQFALFDRESHKFCIQGEAAYEKAVRGRILGMVGDMRSVKPVKTKEHTRMFGVEAVKYVAEYKMEGKQMPVQFWVAENLGLPQQVYDVHGAMSGLPKFPGLCIKLIFGTTTKIDTVSLTRQSIPNRIFNYPGGYTETKDVQDVIFSVDSIKDMLE